ncbi:glyoxylate/hydroxypyruvate reductase A [Thalassotalea sp. LPB0316]|uniref:2-hydroxyacid dehydrogenase n=1 Tax=Thalassotalea sp. LPB0316 TaxID=2769490 RepID=UPI001867316D|nr:glyoxylate/hydroxypyruvate reductase A [Thalassotalea sp. LPB0316]QOL25354.1 glyoxylate/hydroxypyruvate reductase A [Thalassotalea sp. LPB0316]
MSIALVITDRNAEKLRVLLQQRLPEVKIQLWPDISSPEEVTYAVMWKHPVDIWQQLPNIKVAQSLGAGVDHFTFDQAIPEHVILSRIVVDSLAQQMAEYVLGVMLMRQCRLTEFAEQQIQQRWKFQRRLQGKRVLVLGVGQIGDVVARQLQLNGFDVTGWSRTVQTDKNYPCIQGKQALYDALADCDYAVNLLPDTQATRLLIDREFLSACSQQTWLINVGRGNTINEEHLLEACRNGDISGATLDVFQQEPLPEKHPFWQQPNINITPHIAAITDQQEIIEQIADNYIAMTQEQAIKHKVDKSIGY